MRADHKPNNIKAVDFGTQKQEVSLTLRLTGQAARIKKGYFREAQKTFISMY